MVEYRLTERGRQIAYRVGGLLILSRYGARPVDISPGGDLSTRPISNGKPIGPQMMSAINFAKDLGYITQRGNLIYFTRSGVRPVALLYAIWQASLRDELEPTEHFVPVSDFDILKSINILEHIDNAIGGLVSSLAGAKEPPPVSVPIPFRKNLQHLINAGLLVEVR